jgi:SAM-dependent methyltransferase
MNLSESVVDQFCVRLNALLVDDLRYTPNRAKEISAQVNDALVVNGSNNYPAIHDILSQSGVRDRWNTTFRYHRAATIGKWILPYIRGNVLDILCGDGRISRVLQEFGVTPTLTERLGIPESYPDFEKDGLEWIDHDSICVEGYGSRFDTVLLSTALHHEPDPDALLRLSLKIARKRLIIIENCLEEGASEEFHILVDDFFNFGLNQTPLPCPAKHKTIDGWLEMLKPSMVPVFVDRVDSLPGIPLSHHLIVADIRN